MVTSVIILTGQFIVSHLLHCSNYSPLMASADSGDDFSLTPPSSGKTTKKQHSLPEIWPKNEHCQETDNTSDGMESPTEQTDGQRRTYSYMSPISSDADDIPEKSQRTHHAKQGKNQPMKSSHQEKPKRRGSDKKTQDCSQLSPAKSESEPHEYISEVSQMKKGRARKEIMTSPKGSDQVAKNGVNDKAKSRKRHDSRNVSTDNDSETFCDKLTKILPMSRKSQGKCRVSTEKAERVEYISSDLESSGVRSFSMSEEEDARHDGEHQAKNSTGEFHRRIKHRHSDSESFDTEDEDVEEKPKMRRVRVIPKQKDQGLKMLLRKSDLVERPNEGSSSKPRVKKIEGRGSRKAVPIECEICGRSIRCKAILERHMLTHTGEKPFECDECGKHYTSSSNLRIHQLSHSGKMDYVCNECGQKFTHLPYLKRHLLRHSGKKMHICEHCGKGFIQKYHLLRHIMVHTRQMPHACDKCGMSFNRTDYLNQHLRNVHLIDSNTPKAKAEKLYKCETCNKSFGSHTSLETHKRVHTGAMPYTCIVCSRQFKQSSHLYSHMFTHASEKPHACNLCELKFTRKGYLRKHKERMHTGAGDAQSS
ncbi:hypothetical protein Q7C36_013790 [Tachysurus vachellii]|uniref:C2H2-type domain-containing protein n=1 Tax=Tachysurus vachellii TaxID=175792 RepID=A0AA88MLZ0_TACVA|nr:hypothetical protein Q7C36_013790 [Tachysurus vachellii]